jgi:hypothetical protein
MVRYASNLRNKFLSAFDDLIDCLFYTNWQALKYC